MKEKDNDLLKHLIALEETYFETSGFYRNCRGQVVVVRREEESSAPERKDEKEKT